jgi:hypothetical protein
MAPKPFPARLAAVIDADAPMERAGVLADVAGATGFHRIEALERMPARVSPTRTLGDVPYLPRSCWVTIDADHPLPRAGTWGEVVRAWEAR